MFENWFHPNITIKIFDRVPKDNRLIQKYLAEQGLLKSILLEQVHGVGVLDADISSISGSIPRADASVTSTPGCHLVVQTADCVPVLLACSRGKVIGVAHCGWRSARKNILQPVVGKMRQKGAHAIQALIGPSIFQKHYEVDEAFYADFLQEDRFNVQLFQPSVREGHYLFDLREYVYRKLEKIGVDSIGKMEEDTYSQPEKYPSWRRTCHRGGEVLKEVLLSTIRIRD